MEFTSPPALMVWRPWVMESTSENWRRCSSGKAGRGRALGRPYPRTFATLTLGPVPFAEVVSRSRDHWKRKLLTMELVRMESQLATKMRSRITFVPFAVRELLDTVGADE